MAVKPTASGKGAQVLVVDPALVDLALSDHELNFDTSVDRLQPLIKATVKAGVNLSFVSGANASAAGVKMVADAWVPGSGQACGPALDAGAVGCAALGSKLAEPKLDGCVDAMAEGAKLLAKSIQYSGGERKEIARTEKKV